MKKHLTVIITMSCLVASFAAAKTWQMQFDDEKIASIEFPDSWEVNQSREFIEGWSSDKASHVVVSIMPMRVSTPSSEPHRVAPDGTDIEDTFSQLHASDELDKTVESLVDEFKDDQVDIDRATKQAHNSANSSVKGFSYEGKREGKPLDAGTGAMVIGGKAVTFTYWCLKENQAKLRPEIGKILQSIKPLQGRNN
jgi:hypothetical protein